MLFLQKCLDLYLAGGHLYQARMQAFVLLMLQARQPCLVIFFTPPELKGTEELKAERNNNELLSGLFVGKM